MGEGARRRAPWKAGTGPEGEGRRPRGGELLNVLGEERLSRPRRGGEGVDD